MLISPPSFSRLVSAIVLLVFTASGWSQSTGLRISGRITEAGQPMADVSILIAQTDIATASDENGRYEIDASAGDVLVYSHLGMETVEVIVEDVTRVLNIDMEPRFEELDEVIVEQRVKSQKILEEQYATNPNIIKTAYGYVDRERLSFSIRIFDGDELSLAGIDFLGSLQSKVAGLRIFRPPGDPTRPIVFLPRRFNSPENPVPVSYEVDGVIYSEPPTFIQVPDIERIAVINSPGALTRYGGLAAGGLIVINTKVGTFKSEPGEEQPFDQARLRDNIFREDQVGRIEKTPIPKDLEKLMESTSLEEALIFAEHKMLDSHPSPYFVMDMGRYFLEQWGAKKYYLDLLEKVYRKHEQNAVVLKAVAYSMEEVGEFETAQKLYKQIFKVRPRYGQSYRDLAHAYKQNRDTLNSFQILNRYIQFKNLNSRTATKGIDSIIKTEFDNLVLNQLDDDISQITGADESPGTRILFEWNNGDTEFELQFVNPENHFFTWKHSYKENYDLIKKEKLEGYSSEQFFIDQSLKGKWQINLKYLGNKTFDPTYLKCTVYHHYGTAFERQEVRLFRLTQKNTNTKLFSLINNPIVASKP